VPSSALFEKEPQIIEISPNKQYLLPFLKLTIGKIGTYELCETVKTALNSSPDPYHERNTEVITKTLDNHRKIIHSDT
jgi:hypothetical protein